MDEQTMQDRHGVDVHTLWWPVDDPGREVVGIVLVSHGASEHAGRYDRFARALNDAGYAVAALDHRGHGRTSEATGVGVMGAGGGDAVVDDLVELRTAAIERLGDVPVFFFGHSLGSLIGLAYVTQHAADLRAAVLCGFPVGLDEAAATGELLRSVADSGMRDEPASDLLAANNEPFEPARTRFDWLSRDPAEVDAYLADPYCGDQHPLTYGYFLDIFDIVSPAADRLADISCPVLVIAGDQDPAAGMGAHPTKLADALRAVGVDTDLTLYADARHELLNETNRDEVTADIVAWLTAQL